MGRGWTWIDEDAERTEEFIATHTPVLDELARMWSELTTAQEQRRFAHQADMEDGYYPEPEYDTDEEFYAAKLMETERANLKQAEIDAIEERLAHYGARMMRAYEHWNEDEAYMQYMERDREGE